jgi:UDPglucose--hexose-1-phosphate uridylyltransferase
MQIFENKGAAMGCSNPHPHGQIWTTTGLPEEASTELVQLVKYRKEHNGAHLLEDYAKLEVEKKERIVFQNKSFLVVCPVRLLPLLNSQDVPPKPNTNLPDSGGQPGPSKS